MGNNLENPQKIDINTEILKFDIMSKNYKKIRLTLAWIISAFMAAIYLYSASGKLFLHPEQMVQNKLGDWRIIIALGEMVSALLFLLPRTTNMGALLLSSYMGGAIIVHMTRGSSIIIPTLFLIMVWAVLYLRNPSFFEQVFRKR